MRRTISAAGAGLVRAIEPGAQVLLRARPRELHDRRPQLKRRGKAVIEHIEEQEIQSERLVGLRADGRGPFADLFGGEVMAA
jgi:hypothetical protein